VWLVPTLRVGHQVSQFEAFQPVGRACRARTRTRCQTLPSKSQKCHLWVLSDPALVTTQHTRDKYRSVPRLGVTATLPNSILGCLVSRPERQAACHMKGCDSCRAIL
jgi:hypothetical protein